MLSSFETFTRSKDRQDRYQQAVRLLREAEVHIILRELSSASSIPRTSDNMMEVAAAEHFENVGYQRCLSDLFNLVELGESATQVPTPDFGAVDALLAEGKITAKEAVELREAQYVRR